MGSALALLFWSGQGLSDLCSSVFIRAHALYSYAYAGVWAAHTCCDRVIFSMHLCGQV